MLRDAADRPAERAWSDPDGLVMRTTIYWTHNGQTLLPPDDA